MRSLALCYHDVAPEGVKSGFQTPDAETYKLTVKAFEDHLGAIVSNQRRSPYKILLTFDDGGAGACHTADAIEKAGFRGTFFVTSTFVGQPAFVTAAQARDLHNRGHIIGSHGATHRGRMNRMPADRLSREWADSVAALSSIIGTAIRTASVPSGYYSPRVAQAAAAEGIREIFTQEPTTRVRQSFGCEVVGRFTMRSWTAASRVGSLVRGSVWPRVEDWSLWRMRGVAKSIGGNAYTELRRAYYHRRSPEGVS